MLSSVPVVIAKNGESKNSKSASPGATAADGNEFGTLIDEISTLDAVMFLMVRLIPFGFYFFACFQTPRFPALIEASYNCPSLSFIAVWGFS
jgi:hypothetical protein